MEVDAVVRRLPGDGAIHRARVHVSVAEPRGNRARDRSFAGSGRAVDSDDDLET